MGSIITMGRQEENKVLLHNTPALLSGLAPAFPLLQAASLPELGVGQVVQMAWDGAGTERGRHGEL